MKKKSPPPPPPKGIVEKGTNNIYNPGNITVSLAGYPCLLKCTMLSPRYAELTYRSISLFLVAVAARPGTPRDRRPRQFVGSTDRRCCRSEETGRRGETEREREREIDNKCRTIAPLSLLNIIEEDRPREPRVFVTPERTRGLYRSFVPFFLLITLVADENDASEKRDSVSSGRPSEPPKISAGPIG